MNDTWIMVIICILIAMFACVLLFVIAIYVREYWKFLEVPHERPKPIMATMKALCSCGSSMVEDPDEAEEHYRRLYHQFRGSGPFCGFYDVLEPRVLVLDHELVKQILVKDFSNFNDHGVFCNPRHDPLSADLYSSFGKSWKEMRYRLEPVFMLEQMSNLYAQTYVESDQLLQTITQLQKQQQLSQPHDQEQDDGPMRTILDMQQHMRRFVLGSIARGVFGLNTVQLQQKYPLDEFEAMTQLMLTTHRHGAFLTRICESQPTLCRHLGLAITNKKADAYFRALIDDVAQQRESGGAGIMPQDYMQLLTELLTQELNTHETQREGDTRNLREHLLGEMAAHAFTFVKRGYESVAHTLTMALFELATHQEVQVRAREEVCAVLAKHNNEWNYDCVHELSYLGQIIAETIRLHAVEPFLVRRALHDYRLPNHPKYIIRKDMLIIIPIDAMHHDPNCYPEPDSFNPDRFSPELSKQRDQCTWLGYGAGPRNCIGFFYSQLQMRIVLGRLLTHYRFKLPQHLLVIRYEEGMNLLVEELTATEQNENTTNVDSEMESCESKTMI